MARVWIRLGWVVCLLASGCARWPAIEYSGATAASEETLRDSPVVLIGQVTALRRGPANTNGRHLVRVTLSVENILRGDVPAGAADIYLSMSPAAEDNSVDLNERYVFFLTRDGGTLRGRRSLHVASGRHAGLPSSDAPAAERLAVILLTPGDELNPARFVRSMPESVEFALAQLGRWRTAGLLQALGGDPRGEIRLGACEALTREYWGQDACWSELDDSEWKGQSGFSMSRATERQRRQEAADPDAWWKRLSAARTPAALLDELRLLTAHRDGRIREKYCRFLRSHYPGENDCGCYAHPAKGDPGAVMM